MLPKQNRLKTSSEFQSVYKKGTHLRANHFKFIYLKRGDSNPYRLGIVVSSKLGNAVKRNLAKRRVRSVFRNNTSKIPSSLDISIIFWDISLDYKSLESQVLKILEQVAL